MKAKSQLPYILWCRLVVFCKATVMSPSAGPLTPLSLYERFMPEIGRPMLSMMP